MSRKTTAKTRNIVTNDVKFERLKRTLELPCMHLHSCCSAVSMSGSVVLGIARSVVAPFQIQLPAMVSF